MSSIFGFNSIWIEEIVSSLISYSSAHLLALFEDHISYGIHFLIGPLFLSFSLNLLKEEVWFHKILLVFSPIFKCKTHITVSTSSTSSLSISCLLTSFTYSSLEEECMDRIKELNFFHFLNELKNYLICFPHIYRN